MATILATIATTIAGVGRTATTATTTAIAARAATIATTADAAANHGGPTGRAAGRRPPSVHPRDQALGAVAVARVLGAQGLSERGLLDRDAVHESEDDGDQERGQAEPVAEEDAETAERDQQARVGRVAQMAVEARRDERVIAMDGDVHREEATERRSPSSESPGRRREARRRPPSGPSGPAACG